MTGRTFRLMGAALLCAACSTSNAGDAPAAAPAQAPVLSAQTSGTNALLIAVAPVNDNVVWVSGAQGTWARTTDGGTTWTAGKVPGADSLQFRDVHALDATTAYLLSIGDGPQSRIYRTTNGGGSWQLQFTNDNPRGFYDCFDFWDAQRAVVIGDAIDGRVQMLGTANGTTWQALPNSLSAPNGEGSFAASGLCVETVSGGHGWIVASNPETARILHTSDYGRTWSATALPITTHQGSGPQSVSFRDAQNGIVLGGGYQALPGDVLSAITTDGGRTWQPRARMPQRTGAWGGVYVPGAANTVVAVGPNGIAYSRDNAGTWTQADTLNYWSVGFASRRAGWAVGAGGRITKITGF